MSNNPKSISIAPLNIAISRGSFPASKDIGDLSLVVIVLDPSTQQLTLSKTNVTAEGAQDLLRLGMALLDGSLEKRLEVING